MENILDSGDFKDTGALYIFARGYIIFLQINKHLTLLRRKENLFPVFRFNEHIYSFQAIF